MVDPTDEMQKNYEFLLETESVIISKLQHGTHLTFSLVAEAISLDLTGDLCSISGVKLSEVYDAAAAHVKKERPAFAEKITKNAGLVFLCLFLALKSEVKQTSCSSTVLFILCSFGMGIEFREGSLLIASKTHVPAKKGNKH